jgi:hypothetical protein
MSLQLIESSRNELETNQTKIPISVRQTDQAKHVAPYTPDPCHPQAGTLWYKLKLLGVHSDHQGVEQQIYYTESALFIIAVLYNQTACLLGYWPTNSVRKISMNRWTARNQPVTTHMVQCAITSTCTSSFIKTKQSAISVQTLCYFQQGLQPPLHHIWLHLLTTQQC